MNRKQKKELRQRQSTRQLMGIVRVTPHSIVTDSGERVFFLIQPDNLSVLSPEVIRGRVRSLTMLLSTQPTLEILALDSRESFQRNKEYYLRRLEEETEHAVRELLERDMAHLDAIQFSSASSRKFVLVLPLDEKAGADEGALRQLEKSICDHGLRVRLTEEQDVKRLLAIYYRQDLTTEVFRDFDGEEYVHGYEDKHHNCVFVGKDGSGEAKHAHIRSTNSEGRVFRMNIEGSASEHCFHKSGTDKSLYVFEAPIDLLSHITLYPYGWQEHSYVACCGLSIQPVLERLRQNPKLDMVYLCLDNDDAGNDACDRMTDTLEDMDLDVERLCPVRKDWNDDLCAKFERKEKDT